MARLRPMGECGEKLISGRAGAGKCGLLAAIHANAAQGEATNLWGALTPSPATWRGV